MSRIPADRLAHLAKIAGFDIVGLSDVEIFDRMADISGVAANLTAGQKRRVLKRLGGKKKWAGADFVGLVIREMKSENGKLLRERHSRFTKLQKEAERHILRQEIAASLSQPASRLASEPEHQQVLAGLPGSHFYKCPEWLASRADALRLSGYRCEWCGATRHEVRLEVDHIVPRLIAPERAFDLSNLRVLCKPCHDGRHAGERGLS